MPKPTVLLVAAIAAFIPLCAAQAEADLILHNGTGITMEGPEARAEAIAIEDGIIIAVGSADEVMAHRGADSEVIDLQGRTFLPGFIDAHGHLLFLGITEGLANLSSPPVGTTTDIDSLIRTLRSYITTSGLAEDQWIIGFGYDDSMLTENRHPTRADLDAISSTRPIMLTHASGHLGVMNSAALSAVGIDADTENPDGGIIRREADGRTPNGVLEENAFFAHSSRIAPSSPAGQFAALARGQQTYIANGVTTAQDGRMPPAQVQLMRAAAQNDALSIDVVGLVAMENAGPTLDTLDIGGEYQGRFRAGGIKLSLDGSPQGRTAWLQHPVPVPPDGQEAGYRGYGVIPNEELYGYLRRAAENNWQVFAHVNGDAAAQQLIDGVAASGIPPEARTVAIHNQVVTAEQLARQRELGIHPSFFAAHTFYWGDWHRDVAIGQVRADFISPQRAALDIGLTPTTHNDSPVVPPDMMRLVWSSVTRRTRSGDILGPAQRVTPYEALTMVTRNAAWQIGEEDSKGRLAIGMRADIAVLSADPTAVAPDDILEIDVVATIKDGEVIGGSIAPGQ